MRVYTIVIYLLGLFVLVYMSTNLRYKQGKPGKHWISPHHADIT